MLRLTVFRVLKSPNPATVPVTNTDGAKLPLCQWKKWTAGPPQAQPSAEDDAALHAWMLRTVAGRRVESPQVLYDVAPEVSGDVSPQHAFLAAILFPQSGAADTVSEDSSEDAPFGAALVVTARIPVYLVMMEALRSLHAHLAASTNGPMKLDDVAAIEAAWCAARDDVYARSARPLPSAGWDDGGEMLGSWRHRYAVDPLVNMSERSALPIAEIHRVFSYDALRTMQSILLCGESLLVCAPQGQVASAVCVTLPALVAPFPCVHDVLGAAPSGATVAGRDQKEDHAVWAVIAAASNGSNYGSGFRPVIMGIHPSHIPGIITRRFTAEERGFDHPLWIADCRTGQLARCPTIASAAVKPLVLVPVMERLKDAYRQANAPPESVWAGLADSMCQWVGRYRRSTTTGGGSQQGVRSGCSPLSLLQASGGSTNSDAATIAVAERFGRTASWLSLSEELSAVERSAALQRLIVDGLRDAPSAASKGELSAVQQRVASPYSLSLAAFVLRCARRFPDLYAQEYAAAGRPLKESGAGRFFKDFVSKAKEAVSTQFGSSGLVEISANALPYCQCVALFQDGDGDAQQPGSSKERSPGSTFPVAAPLRRRLEPPLNSSVLPLDVVHHFDEYHPRLPRCVPGIPTIATATSSASVTPPAVVEAKVDDTFESPVAPSPSPPVAQQPTDAVRNKGSRVLDDLFSFAPPSPSPQATPPLHRDVAAPDVSAWLHVGGVSRQEGGVPSVAPPSPPPNAHAPSWSMDALFGGVKT